MNKKTLLIKIVEFINKANIEYKHSNYGDIILLLLIVAMFIFNSTTALLLTLIVILLRAIHEFKLLNRLGVIDEENKKNDEEIIENTK